MSARDYHTLIDFQLDAVTIRISDTFMVLSDNRVYEGWLAGQTELRRSLGGILAPRLVSPSMQITIDNRNDQMMALIDQYRFDNRPVVFSLGTGYDADDYDEIFVGTVKQGGIEADDEQVIISIDARFSSDDRNIPIAKFFLSTYPNMEERARYQPIPIPYGDWRSSVAGGEMVPCYQIDSTVGTGGRWKFTDRAIKEIEQVKLNGSPVSISSVDLASAEFTLDVAYDPTIDVVGGNIRGVVDGSNDLIETMPDVYADLLSYGGVDASKIDADALAVWQSNLSANDVVRRVITAEALISTYLTELLIDGFADQVVENGKYKPVYRIVSISDDVPTFHAFDIVDQTKTRKDIKNLRDPENVFTNEILTQAQFDPITSAYNYTAENADEASILEFQNRRRRRLTLNWLYLTAGIEARSAREKFVFSADNAAIAIRLHPVARTLGPTGQFRLVYGRYDQGDAVGTPFQIRTAANDLHTGRLRAVAINMMQMSPGRWTASGLPTWPNASAWGRFTNGYYTDASGYADPLGVDETSKRYFWF